MPRLLLSLAVAAVFGLAGTTAGYGRNFDRPAAAGVQVAQADKTDAKTTRKAVKKRTRKAKRKTRRRTRYGKVYLTAYAKNGRQRKAGKFGTRLRLYLKATKSRKTKKGKRRAGRTEALTYCGKTYYTTRRGARWVAAHKKAGHVLVVRRHTARKKFATICGKKPKRAKRKSTRKKNTKKRTTAKKVDDKS